MSFNEGIRLIGLCYLNIFVKVSNRSRHCSKEALDDLRNETAKKINHFNQSIWTSKKCMTQSYERERQLGKLREMSEAVDILLFK